MDKYKSKLKEGLSGRSSRNAGHNMEVISKAVFQLLNAASDFNDIDDTISYSAEDISTAIRDGARRFLSSRDVEDLMREIM